MPFFDEILVYRWNLDDDILGPIRDALACEAGLQGRHRGLVELIKLIVRTFITGVQALFDNDVTGGTGAYPSTDMLQFDTVSHCNVKQTAGKTCLTIRNFSWIYLDFGGRPARREVSDRIRLLRKLNISLLYIRVGSTHVVKSFQMRPLLELFVDTSEYSMLALVRPD
jgi:hypothetical protein